MECLVSQPNSEVLDIAVDPKGKGQELMDQLCRNLGIVEQDYFGLLYKGRDGENLWLNLRNRLDRQLAGPPPYRLQLKVRYFVQPHKLTQQLTRQQFYEQVRAEFNSQKLVAESEEQMIRMLALIVQAEHGNFDPRTQQMDRYKTVLSDICEPTPELINRIVNAHTHLVGLSKESAQYKVLQEAAGLQNYGFEYHEAVYGGDTSYVGIGPTGVFRYNTNMELIEKFKYETIKKISYLRKRFFLKVMNDNGNEREIMWRLATYSATTAMFWCTIQMHAFFRLRTVNSAASTFNSKTLFGRDYVFDIKRTSHEAYDHASRLLYQPVPSTGTTEGSVISDKDSHDCDTPSLSAQEKCQEQEIIEEEYTINIHREPGQGLGISIAGGKGSPLYKGEDERIFISMVSEDGPAGLAGIKVGDKLMSVNGIVLHDSDHYEAVDVLKSSGNDITMVVGRETVVTRKTEDEEEEDDEVTEEQIQDINSILDPHDAHIFNKALKEGTGKDNYVRVNVVGYHAQGKTSLIRRLLNQPLEGIESTDGIDVHVRKCKMKETEWESFETENDANDCLARLAEAAISFRGGDEIEEQVLARLPEAAKSFREVDEIEEQAEREIRSDTETRSQTEQSANQSEISEEQFETYTILNKPSSSDTYVTLEKTSSDVSAVEKIAGRDIGLESSFIINHSSQLIDKSQMVVQNYLSANIWDFGGQFIYYATHQIFHSSEAIYLLVFDLTKDLNEGITDNDFPARQREMKNCLKFWLDSIHAFVGPDDDEENETQHSIKRKDFRSDIVSKSEPTVIFVGTHKDQFEGDITNKFNEVTKLFAGTKSRNHISPRRFAVSNTDLSDKEIEKLRNTIFLLGKDHAERKQVPMKWIPLEIALLTEKKKNIITMEEVKRLNSENENLVKEEEMKPFLKYHHQKGTLIYFDEKHLDQHVVVNPQYLIDAFRCIIRPREFWVSNEELQPLWEVMNTTAIVDKKLIDAVWSEDVGKNFSNNADVLLGFLQKHRILGELRVTDEKGNADLQERYMIPSLMKQFCERDKLKKFHGRSPRTRIALRLHIKNMEVNTNIFERVTAASLGKWSPIKFGDQIMVFQNVGIYALDEQHAGQIELDQHTTSGQIELTTRGIQLTVINQCQQEVEAKVCDHFRRYVESVINNEFHKLKARKRHGNTYNYYVSCNNHEHGGIGSVNIREMNEVKEKERVRCPDNENHPMECKKGVEEWFPASKLSDDYDIPLRRVTQQDLVDVAGCLGKNWELLGHMLGIRDVEIDRMKMDYPGQTVTCIYHMLHKWEEKEQENATLFKLINSIDGCKSIKVDNDGMKNIVDK